MVIPRTIAPRNASSSDANRLPTLRSTIREESLIPNPVKPTIPTMIPTAAVAMATPRMSRLDATRASNSAPQPMRVALRK